MYIKSNCHNAKSKKILLNNGGIAAVEFAIMLPVFLILAFACIEFGMYFVKYEVTASAVSNVSQTIQRNPGYYSSLTPAQLNAVIKSYGSGLIDFTQAGNYICVDSYTTPAGAQGATACTSTYFNTANPNGAGSVTPYYIAVRSDLKKATITPLGNFLPAVNNIRINQSSGVVQVGSLIPPDCTGKGYVLQYIAATSQYQCVNTNPPICNQDGYALQFDGTNYVCNPIAPNCTKPWQKLEYSSGSFTCVNVPYVVAAGIAHPSGSPISPSPGSYWETDISHIAWMPNVNHALTLCQPNVTFTVPAGLPPGQILATGTLLYPIGADGNGSWHSWVVAFLHFDAPLAGGTGNMDVCESNGGNYISDGSGAFINSEHISWSIFYVPN